MNKALTLISHHLCPYVQRAVIALTEKKVAFERIDIDLSNKPDWFLAISPLGKTPVLQTGENAIFESAVILEYLEETQAAPLHPTDPLKRAGHRAWIEFASAALNDVAGFYNAKDQEAFEAKRMSLVKKFGLLERQLGDGPFFAGPDFSLVDAAFGPLFRYFDTFDHVGDFGFFDDTPRVRAYRVALADRSSVREAVGTDYPERLMEFLRRRASHLSTLIDQPSADRTSVQTSATKGAHHVGLTVPDLSRTRAFFVDTLGFTQIGGLPDYPSAFVTDGTTMITLWQAVDPERAIPFDRKNVVGLHHLALKVETAEALESLRRKLDQTKDIEIEFPPEPLNEGPVMHMMCSIPGGIRMEFIAPAG